MAITLDPTRLPKLDILSLAQNGLILRAERTTPEAGIPSFLTRAGWNELIAHHRHSTTEGGETEEQTASRLLPALERISARLLSEAAREAEAQGQQDASVFTLETDLFPSSAQTRLVLVADRTHPVACALIGTPEQITQLLASSTTEPGDA
ncbi:hypothetical protein AL01_06090 [Bombella intestini]|uniref:Uncharacterized protein n=1 Tax=Bombella intestini TaxID=1539051 RepID=A0A1S8GPN8_9PROT|nr:hypothetical protein [Bombella intestini]OOL18363.1 hypothetical protein AL01_06090 [Bombella intestini]